MSLRNLAMPVIAIALAGCLSTGDPGGGQQNYGFVFLETNQLETGEYVLDPNAIFYRTGFVQLPGTGGTHDVCEDGPYVEPPTGSFPPTVSAGESLQLTLSGNITQLDSVTEAGQPRRYLIVGGDPVEFTPGDTATLVVPGASPGFPSWTIRAKTAEAFEPSDVPIPAEPTELQLNWSPLATGPNSRMTVSLLYFTEGGEREQIYCELNDDGEYRIDADIAEGWRIGQAEGREAIFTRWRITGEAVAGSALLVLSTFQVPTPQIATP